MANQLKVVVKATHDPTARPNELARTMAPHPLIDQELAYDPEYFVYNSRLATSSMNNYTPDEVYWQVRRNVIMRHTGELPTEIKGPDAENLLNKVFTRKIDKVCVNRCSYQFACYHDGGMITDGVLMRLAPDRFWYAQADGDLFSWLKAQAVGMDVEVFDPNVWVSQVQGPNALKVKDMIIRGGENHFPAEIENVLLEHPTVAEVAVVGLPDEKWGEIIACFIRSEGNQPLAIDDLRRFCREQLSPQKTPSIWCRVDEFPLTGSGKIQKFALRENYMAGKYKE